MTQLCVRILKAHSRTLAALAFSFAFSIAIAYATPPGTAYDPGETLDPTCAPGDTNCTVSIVANWGTTGSDVYYNLGKVGIGTTTPNKQFTIAGPVVGNEATALSFDSGILTLGGDMSMQSGVPLIDFRDTATDTVMSRMGYIDNLGISITNSFIGFNKKAIFFEHAADENSLVVRYGVLGFGIPTRVGIGTGTPTSRFDVRTDQLGTNQTTTSGIALTNTSNAENTLQQISPALRWTGYGWKTNATAASEEVSFRSFVTPVQGTAHPTGFLGFGSSINGAAYSDNQFVLTSEGRVGIATTSPLYLFHVGSAGTTTGTTVARFENAGGTCDITPSAPGGITCTSDQRLKKQIVPLADDVLEKILGLNIVNYNLVSESDDALPHTGVVAQELEQVFPDLVATDSKGYKSVSYAGLTPYIIKSIQELNLTITSIADLQKPNTWRTALLGWFADAANGINRFFAREVETKNLCISDDTGTTCITKGQLDALLQGGAVIMPPPHEEVHEDTPDETGDTPTDTGDTPVDTPPASETVPTSSEDTSNV